MKPSARAVSTVPFAVWSGRPPATTGIEGELGRLRDGDPDAEQRRQDVQQHLRVQKRKPDCDDGLPAETTRSRERVSIRSTSSPT